MIVGIYYQQGKYKEFYEYVLSNNLNNKDSLSSLISSAIYTSLTDDKNLTIDYCERILKLEKNNAIAISLKIAALSKLGKLKDALELATKSLEMHSGNLGIIEEVYNIFFKLGLYNSCELALNTALKLHPDSFRVKTKLFLTKKFSCDWEYISQHSHIVSRIGLLEPTEPFACLAIEDNPYNQLERSKIYLNSIMPAQRTLIKQKKHDKVRIGYFSSDFFEHATMHLLSGLLREHDLDHFDIYIYDFSLYGDDKMSDFVQSAKFKYFNINNHDEESIIKLIRDHQLNIALDLKGFTRDSRPRIFTYGLAPIQVNYLGYPSTFGSDHMDYIIADRIIIPENLKDAYSENIIYLPNSYQPNDNTRPQSKLDVHREDFGLPKDSFVYCSFNQTYKIGQEEIKLWAKILYNVKNSCLWLYCPNLDLRPKFIEQFSSFGIDENRIIFADIVDNQIHMKRLALADLMLDTFAVNAHTTASDSLWMGVPVVTKIGLQFAARVCASLLTASNLEQLITKTNEEYASIAIKLGNDSSYYAHIRTKLSSNLKELPLFDTTTYTRNFEQAMKRITCLSLHDKVEDIYVE
jgi:protein O-GlcNAc transferase